MSPTQCRVVCWPLANQTKILDLIGFNQLCVFTQIFLMLLRMSEKKQEEVGTQKLGLTTREPLLSLPLEAVRRVIRKQNKTWEAP